MRIIMVCEFFDESLSFQENLLLKYYRKHGHAVTVLTSIFSTVFDYYNSNYNSSASEWTTYPHGGKVMHLRYRYNLLNRVRAYRDLTPILQSERPDLIYVHDISPNFRELTAYVRQHPGCKMIMDFHADYSNSGRSWLSLRVLHGVIRKHFLDGARPHLARIFPVVPASTVFLRDIYKVPESELELLPLGADVDLIQDVQQQSSVRRHLRDRYAIEEGDFVVFSGGKITPRKRTELLLRAIDRPDMSNVHVILVGDFGPEVPDYRDQILQIAHRIGNRVHFAGWQEPRGVYEHMAASDIAVFPASQSVMWQQAVASGLPLVVGDTGGQDISYMNRRGNAIMMRRDEITEPNLSRIISQLVGDDNRRAEMSRNAHITTSELLDWNLIIDKTTRCVRA